LCRDFGLDVVVSLPMVVYMESITHQGDVVCVRSSDKQSSFSIQVEPVQENLKSASKERDNLLYFDDNSNVLVDFRLESEKFSEQVLKSFIDGFGYACKMGPLCGEPMRCVKVKIIDIQFDLNQYDASQEEVMHGFSKAIFASFLTAKPILFEPIYAMTVSLSSELTGECSRILTTRRGKIKGFKQNGLLTTLEGFIPVAETFGFSKELRSATSGRAIWQFIFDHWEKLSERLTAQTIGEFRKRKGLAEDVPKPDKFIRGS
jgi:elongation factor 2